MHPCGKVNHSVATGQCRPPVEVLIEAGTSRNVDAGWEAVAVAMNRGPQVDSFGEQSAQQMPPDET
jgi:hypothetical protein